MFNRFNLNIGKEWRYVIIGYSKIQDEVAADNLMVEEAAKKILSKYAEAFEELAK